MKKLWIGGLCLALLGCGQSSVDAQRVAVASVEALEQHSEEFRVGVEEVAPGVWIAIGYGLANSILVEGDDGLIVIDTMETLAEGRKVARLFREISDKPLAAIIYTHNHTDHVFGAQAFIEELADPDRPVEILAHRDTAEYVYRVVSEYRPIITARSFRMFGTELDAQGLVNDGIGPFLSIDENSEFGFVAPTQTVGLLLHRIRGLTIESTAQKRLTG
jgi:alkyl sulfatase BDS1-like metallo-beta-lactamase superfamily hydrolase